MATPNSKTAITNLALRHLSENPVTSIDPPDPDSKAAAAGAAWYDQARRSTLEAHPWRFAQKKINLAADATAPVFEFAKRYQLPPDFVRMVRIGPNWSNPEEEYDIVENYIECNLDSPLQLVYIRNLDDATKFSPKFVDALSYKLAAYMAFEITNNAQVVGAMEAQFSASLSAAASVQGQNRPTRRVQHSRLKAARQNAGGKNYKDWQRWGDD